MASFDINFLAMTILMAFILALSGQISAETSICREATKPPGCQKIQQACVPGKNTYSCCKGLKCQPIPLGVGICVPNGEHKEQEPNKPLKCRDFGEICVTYGEFACCDEDKKGDKLACTSPKAPGFGVCAKKRDTMVPILEKILLESAAKNCQQVGQACADHGYVQCCQGLVCCGASIAGDGVCSVLPKPGV